MGRSKTSKVQKSSYTERVLGAMTQIQKEHRKHSIHMATLRAQIRKNADAKRDKLGPNWSSWVTKAVQKLAEDGVVDHPNAQEVALTQSGKQIITTAKKALPDEDHLWRHISTSIARGRKRRRSSIGPGQDIGSGLSISAKRTRGSAASDIVGSIHMSPVRSPRKAPRPSQAQVTFRDMSPLTDLSEDDDENASLKAQLSGKEKEIKDLRNQLDALGRSTRSHNSRHDMHVSTPLGAASQIQSALPTPSRRSPVSTTTGRLQVPKGITRTQSGTYIPNISKQPTPAPSDVSDEGDTEIMLGMEEEGAEHSVPGSFLSAPRSPSLHEDEDVEEGLKRVDNAADGLPSSRLVRDDGSAALLTRVGKLEQLVEAKELDLFEMRVAMDNLETQKSTLQGKINTLQTRLTEETANLQSEVQAQESEIAALDEDLRSAESARDDAQAMSSSERETRLGLQAKLADVEGELGASRVELAGAMDMIDQLTTESEGKGIAVAGLEASLETAREQIQQLNDSLADLRAEHDAEKAAYEKTHLLLDERSRQVEAFEADLLREKGIRESLEQSLSGTTERLASVESKLLEVQDSADEKEKTLGSVAEKLSGLEAAKAQLEQRNDVLQQEAESTRQALSASQSLVERSNGELATKESLVQDLSAKLADAESRIVIAEEARRVLEDRAEGAQQELNRKILSLEEKVATDQVQIGKLHSMRAGLEVQLDQERAALVGTRAEALRTTVELELERSRIAVVEGEKIHGEHRIQLLEEELDALKDESSQKDAKAKELEAWVEGLRRSQIATMDALVGKVASLQPDARPMMSVQFDGPTASTADLVVEA